MALDLEAAPTSAVPGDSLPNVSSRRGRRKVAMIVGITVAAVLVAFALLGAFVVSSYVMQGSSMYPTYENGDRVWVNRLASADVGEIAVVRVESLDGREVLKRVVASGGDTIEIADCQLIVNDRVTTEAILDARSPQCGPDFEQMTVPDGHLFLLGDNWAGSQDSRIFGPVPEAGVVGVVIRS